MHMKIIFGIVGTAVILGGLFLFLTAPKVDTQQASVTQGAQTQDTQVAATTSAGMQNQNTTAGAPAVDVTASPYTMKAVATHSGAASCWSAVNGKVYDLTSWISQHPGGAERILSICGKDGSAAFNDQHGGQRRPENELAGFLLGDLSN